MTGFKPDGASPVSDHALRSRVDRPLGWRVLLEPFFKNTLVLDWDRNLFGVLSDAIPKLLNERNTLLFRSFVESRRHFEVCAHATRL